MAFPGMKAEEWDVHAKEYAAMHIEDMMSIACEGLLSALNAVSPLASSTAILDVGCGPGTMVARLIQSYGSQLPPSTRIIASDFSSGMVNCLREKQVERAGKEEDIGGAWTRLESQVQDAQDLEGIKEGELSHVMGNMVYFMLSDPRKGLESAHRVLKEGGAFGLTSWSKVEWVETLHTAALKVRPDAPTGFDTKHMGSWSSAEGVKHELEAAGFKDVKTEYFQTNLPIKDPKMFANMMFRSSNPGTVRVMSSFSAEEVDRACEEWVKLVEGKEILEGVLVVASGKK
jgi:ubiquinone/menaquinone biosynthesis C-methylase UbiE